MAELWSLLPSVPRYPSLSLSHFAFLCHTLSLFLPLPLAFCSVSKHCDTVLLSYNLRPFLFSLCICYGSRHSLGSLTLAFVLALSSASAGPVGRTGSSRRFSTFCTLLGNIIILSLNEYHIENYISNPISIYILHLKSCLYTN